MDQPVALRPPPGSALPPLPADEQPAAADPPVVRPDGSLAHRTQVFTRDVSVTEVALGDSWTLATRRGALPELVLSLLAAGAVAAGLRRRRVAA